MPILKLRPACKDYIWGGSRLASEYGVRSDKDIIAEAWVLSCHSDGPCVIEGGEHDGVTLADYIKNAGKDCLGLDCAPFEDFPILTKLIDAKSALSIQVHPDDDYALKNEGQYGKTEMWIILDADDGAFLYYGFEHEISREEFAERIRDNTLTDVLHKAPVKRGDVFFIPPGTLHAIGAGILIAEVQQNSNVTYRVYDYGRVGADGKPRELHVDKALAVTKTAPADTNACGGHLASCKYFTVDRLDIDSRTSVNADKSSFVHLLITDGEGTASNGGDTVSFRKGDSLFIPAESGECLFTGRAAAVLTRV